MYGIDVDEFFRKQKVLPSIVDYDRDITCKMFGFATPYDYYKDASCGNRIKNI